jgi:hypothetical protein
MSQSVQLGALFTGFGARAGGMLGVCFIHEGAIDAVWDG